MNNSFKKESPLLSLPSLGGGSHSTLVRTPSGGGGGGGIRNASFRSRVWIFGRSVRDHVVALWGFPGPLKSGGFAPQPSGNLYI